MRIYKMTATFGKLEHQTLELAPGLNVLEAPNEWGKSTWCAFLLAMLYGVDTRERSRQGALADKERYKPWSGSPMSGRMDINWNGRDITIERSTRGNRVFGEFKAYETQSGLAVTELTAENCGAVLLGAEKSVFARAGFVRLSDMPVTEDEALRRRLNALVTTGDESGAADDLAQKLKNLRNRCRHHRTGLLPQAEAERDALQEKLDALTQLQMQTEELKQQRKELTQQLEQLENHRIALAYEKSLRDSEKLSEANAVLAAAQERYENLERRCAQYADRETVQQQVLHLEQLQLQQTEMLEQALPEEPVPPQIPEIFAGLSPTQMVQQVLADKAVYDAFTRPALPVWWILALLAFVAAGVMLVLLDWKLALTPLVLGLVFVIFAIRSTAGRKKDIKQLLQRYPDTHPELWINTAQLWKLDMEMYEKKYARWKEDCSSRKERAEALSDNIEACTGGIPVGEALEYWRQAQTLYNALESAFENYVQAQQHAGTVADMLKTADAPAFPDSLTLSEEDTLRKLEETRQGLQRLDLLEGQYNGKREALGDSVLLEKEWERVQKRIAELEDIYTAATLAMDTLQQAATALQRKFAPRIANRARALFADLTGGRYQTLSLTEDLSLMVCAQEENNLRPDLWRSDGTVDQLYLALRLAVAEALMPGAPLVLDDALVRFDDDRLALAMSILQEQAEARQVILFTCQSREHKYL